MHYEQVPGIGLYAGLQRGFECGSGDIMGWLNADDILHRGALHSIGGLFAQRPDIHWMTGLATLIDAQDRIYAIFDHCYRSRIRFSHGDRRWIQQESTYWRRSLWDRVGGLDTSWPLAGDFDLWFRFFQLERLYQFEGLIGAFRTHGAEQLSVWHRQDYLREVSQIIERFADRHDGGHRPSLRRLDSLLKRLSGDDPGRFESLLVRLGLAEEIGLAHRVKLQYPEGRYIVPRQRRH
jgi:hypothetical protein